MAVSPTPEQLEYVHHSTTKGYGSYFLGIQILSLLITLAGLVGNSLVLWLLGFRIKRNPFSVYILNLATADTLFLCFSFLIMINRFISYPDISLMFILTGYVTYMFYTVSLSLLATISTERCLSMLFPVWYRCNRPKHTSTVVCTVLWVVATLLWGTGFVICYNVISGNFCNTFHIIEFVWFLLFTPMMCVSSLILLLRVQCSFRRQQPPRLYLLVLLSVLVFLLCGVPLGILYFLLFSHFIDNHFGLLQLLACVNSSANPFIYFFLGIQRQRRRRETPRTILQRALGNEDEFGDEAKTSCQQQTDFYLGLRKKCTDTDSFEMKPQPKIQLPPLSPS